MGDNGGVSDPETPDAQAARPAPIDTQQATARRAPKLGVFLLVGAALGALVTLVLTSLFPADPNVGFAASFAYFLLYGIPAGLVLGALVGLALDRRSRRRARTVTVEHQRVD
jgi:hypothetical protein